MLLMARSARPRTRAGMSSSTAELTALYSPPMPAPVMNAEERERDEAPGEPGGQRGHQVDRERDEEQALAPEADR